MTQPRKNPARRHLYPHFHFGLVPGFQGARRHDGNAIVVGERRNMCTCTYCGLCDGQRYVTVKSESRFVTALQP
jgi:hypothetical protein